LHALLLHNCDERAFYGINEPFWTIAVQAQVYVLLPFLVWLAHTVGRSQRGTLIVLLLLSGGSYAAHFGLMTTAASVESWPLDPRWINPSGHVLSKSTLAHLPIVLLGAAAGFFDNRQPLKLPMKPWRLSIVFWMAAISALLYVSIPDNWQITPPFARYGFPFLPLLMIVVIQQREASGLMSVLEYGPVRFLGMISYGMYIFHLPCLKLTAVMLRNYGLSANPVVVGALGFACTIFVAILSYFLVERPVYRLWEGRTVSSLSQIRPPRWPCKA
jgi:peptidoglycan/LPS O-acetylase OafA/YrhL